jgi:hypothetical protein
VKFGAHPLSVRGSPQTLEVFLDAHRDHFAFVHNSDLYCPTIFVLRRLVDRFVAGALSSAAM